MKIESMYELYLDGLRDQYSGEQQLIDALPKVVEAADLEELKSAVAQHLEETKQQARRLEQIFDELSESPKGEECEAMKGLIKETAEVIKRVPEGSLRDAALIAAACKVEHYEIAGYGTLKTFAEELGHSQQASLLQSILDEEKHANETLSTIAMSTVNDLAMTIV